MMIKEVVNGVRAWLKAANDLSDDQVIRGKRPGMRPNLPYLSVTPLSPMGQVGTDEILSGLDEDDIPTMTIRGSRVAVINVQAFGMGAGEWLSDAVLKLASPDIQAVMQDAGITIMPRGDMADITISRDTTYEDIYSQDFTVAFKIATDPMPQTALETITIEGELKRVNLDEEQDDAIPFDLTITVGE